MTLVRYHWRHRVVVYSSLAIWLAALAVAPGLAFASEVSLTPSFDTTVKLTESDKQFDAAPVLDMLYDGGMDWATAPADAQESFIQFDVSQVPNNAIIGDATLILTPSGSAIYGYGDIRLRRVTSPWDKTTTWNTRPSYSEESIANLEVANNVFPPSIDVTEAVRGWVAGTYPNHGIALRAFGDGDYKTGLFSGDDAHVSSGDGPAPPKLTIRYSLPTPRPVASQTITPVATSPTTTNVANKTAPTTVAPDNNAATNPPALSGTGFDNTEGLDYAKRDDIKPCQGKLRNLAVIRSDTQAVVTVNSVIPTRLGIYLYDAARAGRDGIANNYADAKITLTESQNTANHRYKLSELTPDTTYYFTLAGDAIKECEHRFTTLTAAYAGTARNQGDAATRAFYKDLLSQKLDSPATPQGNFTAAVIMIKRWLTNNYTVSPVDNLLFFLLGLFAISLGEGAVQRGFRIVMALRNSRHWFFGLTHHQKIGRAWGKVIAATTNRPIRRATVILSDAASKREIARTSTDENGFYTFPVGAGSFFLTAGHGAFSFPSHIMPNAYRGENVTFESAKNVSQLNLAMDPLELSHLKLQQLESFLFHLASLRRIFLVAAGVGAALAFLTAPSPMHGLISGYFIFGLIEEIRRRREVNLMITVRSANHQPIGYVLISIRNHYGLIVQRKITNTQGVAIVPLRQGDYTAELAVVGARGIIDLGKQVVTIQAKPLLQTAEITSGAFSAESDFGAAIDKSPAFSQR